MKYNFNELESLLAVKNALRKYSNKLYNATSRIEFLSSFDDISDLFEQFISEIRVFMFSDEYFILKEYQTFSNCENILLPLSQELVPAFKRKKQTFASVTKVLNKINSISKSTDELLQKIDEAYFI